MNSIKWLIACLLSTFLITLSPLSFSEPESVIATEQQVVHLNSADASTLASVLYGVGPKRAQAIVEYRNVHGPFESADDLVRVQGVSEAILKKNRDKITL